jgi:AraC-like DNA-binding protein
MTSCNSLSEKIAVALPADGKLATEVAGLTLIRTSNQTLSMPVVYTPKLFVIAQGKKDVIAGNQCIQFDAYHYLLLTVPLPIYGRITQASVVHPFLAINLNLDMALVRELVQQMNGGELTNNSDIAKADRAIQLHSLDDTLLEVMHRLLDTVSNPESARILGKMALKEIYYRLLTRKEGVLLRAFAQQDRYNFRIAKVLDYIQANLQDSLSVEELAEMANMSASSFHEHFKKVTDTSPQQYIKSLRLDEARRRLVEEGINVSEAAYRVGYASPSQFSREFKRLFGVSPKHAVAPVGGFAGI